ncbi:hypothetical protein OC844_006597 [Tilletia horrida]|nr:hypothetical protein OC844_006597 [Tilletia horrida]
MQLSKITLWLGLAVASASAVAIESRDTAFCHGLATAGLTNLDQLGCATSAIAHVPVKHGLKDDLCLALYHGGLVNLDKVGCAPTQAILARGRGGGQPKCSTQDLCKLGQSGAFNLGLLFCTGRREVKDEAALEGRAGGGGCHSDICKQMQSGLINAVVLGCT